MRPIKLSHDKPLTEVKYNTDGDLLFTASKSISENLSVWWADTGERIGTYDGHRGAIFSIDVDRNSTRLLSGSGDRLVKLWDVETGKDLYSFQHATTVRHVAFCQGDNRFLSVTDQNMGLKSEISVFKLSEDWRDQANNKKPILQITGQDERITRAVWGWRNETIIVSSSDGTVKLFNTERAKQIEVLNHIHKGPIGSIQFDKWKTTFITASKDGFAKLFDTRNMKLIKEYDTGRPLNAASISPLMDHIIVGGGEQADTVTVTGANSAQFKVRFYHKIFGEELGSIMGHFGPVNCLTFSPDGRSFVSGGEDGFARIHNLPESYFARTGEISQY